MKYLHSIRAASGALVLFAALGAGSVFAQPSMTVITDVGPLPAEERESAGAIVLDANRVPALRDASQRDADARRATTRMGSAPATNRMGSGPVNQRMSPERARYEAEQARIRQEEADLKRKGAASVLE
ncbi:MAG: hypothetical protein V4684_08095 [Pseudomonadota bacterium]